MVWFTFVTFVLFSALQCDAASVQFMIDGGENVSPVGKWPFMVSQQVYYGEYIHSCGASLISDFWLVTAAHCVSTLRPSEIWAVLGAHDIKTLQEGDPQRYDIEEIIAHPNWSSNAPGFPNDIALLRLATAANMSSEYVATVPMAGDTDGTFAGDTCYIIGWGLFAFDDGQGEYPNILQEATMDVMSNADCEEIWPQENISPYHICISASDRTACSGDSGGPLVCEVTGHWTLVGVTSWGEPCPSRKANVYARVSYYREWIRQHTGV